MSRSGDAPHDLDDSLLNELEAVLGYSFRDRSLLQRCLRHASAARMRLDSNERLEFLGDAILGAVVCEALFHRFPESPEGELTRIKSVVVSRETCAEIFEKLGMERFLVIGKGLTLNRKVPASVLAAVFEALIGGIALDGGYEEARRFVLQVTSDVIQAAAESATGVNFKSLLQQRTQRIFGETPTYCVEGETGPEHSKQFLISAIVGERKFVAAWGKSKRAAEQRAAENALAVLDDLPPPHPAVPVQASDCEQA